MLESTDIVVRKVKPTLKDGMKWKASERVPTAPEHLN